MACSPEGSEVAPAITELAANDGARESMQALLASRGLKVVREPLAPGPA
jgi:hypothetical protein